MKSLKRTLAVLLITVGMTAALPQHGAQAKVALCPVFSGMATMVLGIYHHETVFLALDADGRVSQDALERSLARRYSFIEDPEVITSLAAALSAKAEGSPLVGGKRLTSLSRDELIQILEPSGLGELRPAEVNELMNDLM